MENASKALIIAGAILISILLISVGILVMQSASGVTSEMEGRMDATAIQSFNATFENYVGTRRGSMIKTLISEVSASNVAHPDDHVKIKFGTGTETDSESDFSNIQRQVKSTARYDISVSKNARGLVEIITIVEEGSGSTGSTTTSI